MTATRQRVGRGPDRWPRRIGGGRLRVIALLSTLGSWRQYRLQKAAAGLARMRREGVARSLNVWRLPTVPGPDTDREECAGDDDAVPARLRAILARDRALHRGRLLPAACRDVGVHRRTKPADVLIIRQRPSRLVVRRLQRHSLAQERMATYQTWPTARRSPTRSGSACPPTSPATEAAPARVEVLPGARRAEIIVEDTDRERGAIACH